MMRKATLGEQLLLAAGRVVSTKVYLSSKGAAKDTHQHQLTWRKKFLQHGMRGTAIVYGNGSADDAMASFSPDDNVLQDSFMAVFTGPEKNEEEEEEEEGPALRKKREEEARAALRKEVELYVHKST